jgi:hypothetical protein
MTDDQGALPEETLTDAAGGASPQEFMAWKIGERAKRVAAEKAAAEGER